MDTSHMPLTQNILSATITELINDFEELSYLYNSHIIILTHYAKTMSKVSSLLPNEASTFTFRHIEKCLSLFTSNSKKIDSVKISLIKKTNINIQHFINLKRHFYEVLRTHQGVFSFLLTATDWQSPSFSHSTYSQAGKQTGQIKLSLNDYKRDHHIDEKRYERSFVKEYIDAPLKFPIVSYVTNSGMSAFSTLLHFLLHEGILKENVVIGNSIYFQNKTLIKGFPHIQINAVNESNHTDIVNCIKKAKPSVIIFDSLTNTNEVFLPDLYQIINFIVKNSKHDIVIIVDNTCLSIAFQPFNLIMGKTRKVQLYVFESLLKYHQFGMDRTNAGIIYGYGKDASKLFYYRRDMGTNISDSAVYSLPTPNRKFLEKRLVRLNRNATYLAVFLQNTISDLNSPKIRHVNYPLLSSHPNYLHAQTLPFTGSFLTLEFAPKHAEINTYKRFLRLAIKEAQKKGIHLIGGTSFGFNVTRMYPVALKTDETIPFLRISAGTETIYEVQKLQEIFYTTIQQL